MNRIVLFLSVAALAAAASAQTTTPAKPATAMRPASSMAKPATTATTAAPATEPWIKLPPGVPRVVHLPVKMPFALRYEDIKIGTGVEGESGKVWHLKYTGWRAADGIKFDSWDVHQQPKMGPDGKPVMGPDGKPVMGDPKPLEIPQGVGRVIPGFDYGLEGMKIGGKRRIFIPWQMAYGTHAIPDRADHPGIPAKADLIFDVELVDVTDMPQRPPMMPGNRPMPVPQHPGASGAQPNAAPTPKPAPPTTQTAPATQPAPSSSAPTRPAAPAQPSATQPSTPPQPQQK